jgi:uncharacterized membrane protein HdeD (DUF308 family)
MSKHDWVEHQSGWKLVLMGLVAIAFGIAVVVLPAGILSSRVLDVIFGEAKPLSASVTAVAALFALVVFVAIDGLVNLLGEGMVGKRGSRIRGVIGLAVAVVAIFWPDWTVVAAVELIAAWAILVGIVEITYAIYSNEQAKDRALFVIAAIASIAIGLVMMYKLALGVVLVSVVVGIAAAVRGVSLIVLGFSRRANEQDRRNKAAAKQAA